MRWIAATLLLGCAASAAAEAPGDTRLSLATALDQRLFDAYNRCDLEAFGALFVADVEFYHDQSGVMSSRDEVVESTRRYICGKVRRELVPGSLKAHPIRDYGLLVLGEHRFCELAGQGCQGIAEFAMLWQQQGEQWRVTRVLSYGHRQAP